MARRFEKTDLGASKEELGVADWAFAAHVCEFCFRCPACLDDLPLVHLELQGETEKPKKVEQMNV
jgi:hypothetical protein